MTAKPGDTVKVHYTGKLQDGTVFDSSRQRDPIAFQIGQGQIIPGFEKAVEGMEPGQTTETTIPADQAYGPRDDNAIVKVERTRLPENMEPQVGQQLQVQQENGQSVAVRIVDVDDTQVTLDANHPLAGQDLTFEIELVSVE